MQCLRGYVQGHDNRLQCRRLRFINITTTIMHSGPWLYIILQIWVSQKSIIEHQMWDECSVCMLSVRSVGISHRWLYTAVLLSTESSWHTIASVIYCTSARFIGSTDSRDIRSIDPFSANRIICHLHLLKNIDRIAKKHLKSEIIHRITSRAQLRLSPIKRFFAKQNIRTHV